MTRPLFAGLVLALMAAVTCGEKKEQSFQEAMQIFCSAPASLPSTMRPADKAAELARIVDRKVANQEARQLFASLTGGDEASNRRLADAVRRAGVERCSALELQAGSPMARSLRIICQAPDKVPLPADADPSARAQLMADYIRANVTDPDALKLMSDLASEAPGLKSAHLASVAREHGIERCPLAEMP